MYKTGHSKSYDLPVCDFCEEPIETPERKMARIKIELSNGMLTDGGGDGGSLSEHNAHLCPECHEIDGVVYPSTHHITAHCNLTGLLMIEVTKEKSKYQYKVTPENCPPEILEPVERSAEGLAGYGREF